MTHLLILMAFVYRLVKSFSSVTFTRVFEGPMILDAFLQATIASGSSDVPREEPRALIQGRENPTR